MISQKSWRLSREATEQLFHTGNSRPLPGRKKHLHDADHHLQARSERRRREIRKRLIMPSLVKVLERLNPSADVQLIASTHAPLVLSSVEPAFSLAKDSLVKFDLIDGNVSVERFPWQSYGDVSSWLTSDIFRLGAARSLEAERAHRGGARCDQSNRYGSGRTQVDTRTIARRTERYGPFLAPLALFCR